MSMRPWEREIIEYHPQIEDTRNILSKVIGRIASSDENRAYRPTMVMREAFRRPGIDLVDKLIAGLSKANDLKKKLDNELANDPRYIEYKEAIANEDPARAREIHYENIKDIDAHPSFDVYPVLEETIEEMEDFLDFVNDELFDGTVDYNDLEPARQEEREILETLVDIEAEDLVIDKKPNISQSQRKLIEHAIKDPDNPIESPEDYMEQIQKEKLISGSPRINYDHLSDRIQVIHVLGKKTDMLDDTVNQIGDYTDKRLKDAVGEDVIGSVEYIHQLRPETVTKDSSSKESSTPVSSDMDSINQDTSRVGDTGVRESIDNLNTNRAIQRTTNNPSSSSSTKPRMNDLNSMMNPVVNNVDLDTANNTGASIAHIQVATKTGHGYHAKKATNALKNMARVGDVKLRKFLDEQLSLVRERKRQIVDSTKNSMNNATSSGGGAVEDAALEGIRSVNNVWKFILSEHVGNSELNADQIFRAFSSLGTKKDQQMIYQYVTMVADTFNIGKRDTDMESIANNPILNEPKFW